MFYSIAAWSVLSSLALKDLRGADSDAFLLLREDVLRLDVLVERVFDFDHL